MAKSSPYWVLGFFAFSFGTLALVAPRELLRPTGLVTPTATGFLSEGGLTAFGALLLFGGVALPASLALARWPVIAWVAPPLLAADFLVLAIDRTVVTDWGGAAAFFILAGAIGALPATSLTSFSRLAGYRWLDVTIGASIVGLVMVALIRQVIASPANHGAFVVSRAAVALVVGLVLVGTTVRRSNSKPVPALHVAAGLVLLVLLVRSPSGLMVIYCLESAAVITALPWLGPRLDGLDARSLRPSLALAAASATAIPLVVAVAIGARGEEAGAVRIAQAHDQAQVSSLARYASAYIQERVAIAGTLAALPNLLDQPPADESAILRQSVSQSPDLVLLATFDSEGRGRGRSDDAPLVNATGSPIFEGARTGAALSFEVAHRFAAQAPGTDLCAPNHDQGQRRGWRCHRLNRHGRLTNLLLNSRDDEAEQIYLVDDQGRTVVGGDQNAALSTFTSDPTVAAWLTMGVGDTALLYRATDDDYLASLSQASPFGLAVVAERPMTQVMSASTQAQKLELAVLLCFLPIVGLGALALSDRVVRPIEKLHGLMETFGTGANPPRGPIAGPTETERLAVAFDNMRDRLAASARERDRLAELLERRNRELWNETIRDPLTGLYNRRYLEDALNREVSRARRGRLTPGGDHD